jgi:hypothetical protein
LVDEVARGDRLLHEIHDPQLRETVRLALRLHKDPFSGPDAAARSRIRSRVLKALQPRRPSIADRTALLFEVMGRPAPYAMRALALALAIVAMGASTAVVSAGTVAEDALYPVKLSSEQFRLALAGSPEDRAVVELSIAEHRLAEAAALASLGNEDDAIVATSEYGEHMANAAAELSQVDSLDSQTAMLVTQLQQRIDEHRATAAAVVARLADDPTTASAASVIAMIASARGPLATDLSAVAAIAQDAADTADQAAAAAERRALPDLPPAETSTDDVDAARAERIAQRGLDAVKSTTARLLTDRGSKRERAAEVARKAAEEAKAAAKKAKEGIRRNTTQIPRHG